MWYVYILLCDEHTYYVGVTHNLEEQIKIHQEGRSFFTKKFKDFKLVYEELHPNQLSATKREQYIKSLNDSEKLKLINDRA